MSNLTNAARFVISLSICYCLAATTMVAAEQDPILGKQVMPKMDAVFRIGNRVVSWDEIDFPMTIKKVSGEWIWVNRGWVLARSVIPLEDAFDYYTEYLKTHPSNARARKLRNICLMQSLKKRLGPPAFDGRTAGGIELHPEPIQNQFPSLSGRGLPTYQFRVKGTLPAQRVHFWQKPFGEKPEQIEPNSTEVDDHGLLATRNGDVRTPMPFTLGFGFAKGEAIQFCVTSVDGSQRAFAEIIPFPIVATNDRGYKVSLKLLSRSSYSITASGFESNKVVTFLASVGSFVDEQGVPHDATKSLPLKPKTGGKVTLIWKKPAGRIGGSVQLSTVGANGSLNLSFNYGNTIKAPRDEAIKHLKTASDLYDKKEYKAALSKLGEAIDSDATFIHAYLLRGAIRLENNEGYEQIEKDLGKVLEVDPTLAAGYRLRGVLRASSSDASFRDGAKAVADLTRACELTHWKKAYYLADLGAAYAEAGDFEKAIHWQKKAIELNPEDQRMATIAEMRLTLYRQGKPYHLAR